MDTLHFAVPESFFELLFQILGTILSLLLGIGMTWLNRYLKRKANIVLFENEEQMRQRLFVAISNGVNNAVEKVDAKELDKASVTEKTLAYVKATVPDSVKGLKANDQALTSVIGSHLNKIVSEAAYNQAGKPIPSSEIVQK